MYVVDDINFEIHFLVTTFLKSIINKTLDYTHVYTVYAYYVKIRRQKLLQRKTILQPASALTAFQAGVSHDDNLKCVCR